VAIDVATGTLLGTIVGSTLAFLGTWLKEQKTVQTALKTKQLEGELALHNEREAQTFQRTSEAEKWYREQLQVSLMETAYLINMYITQTLVRELTDYQKDPEVTKTAAELQRCIVSILAFYSDKSNSLFLKLKDASLRTREKAVMDRNTAWELRGITIDLSADLSPTNTWASMQSP
jgi:hypothetical protein